MSVLDNIVANKVLEVTERKRVQPLALLEQAIAQQAPPRSLTQSLRHPQKSGIIAEFKRKSPSKGEIHPGASVQEITAGYVAAGASGLSVLTDTVYFGGSEKDLREARAINDIPILRKDFMVDPYQVVEARAMGADVILLIAACLEKEALRSLAALAHSLGMEVLMEVHTREELDHWNEHVDMIGVNNRNLKTMHVDVQTSFDLYEAIPSEVLAISESGIDDPALVVSLRQLGYQGFLMGEFFMKQPVPALACAEFTKEMNRLDDLLKNAIA